MTEALLEQEKAAAERRREEERRRKQVRSRSIVIVELSIFWRQSNLNTLGVLGIVY